MTFSIVARSADGESWGVAVASKFLAVGSAVPVRELPHLMAWLKANPDKASFATSGKGSSRTLAAAGRPYCGVVMISS